MNGILNLPNENIRAKVSENKISACRKRQDDEYDKKSNGKKKMTSKRFSGAYTRTNTLTARASLQSVLLLHRPQNNVVAPLPTAGTQAFLTPVKFKQNFVVLLTFFWRIYSHEYLARASLMPESVSQNFVVVGYPPAGQYHCFVFWLMFQIRQFFFLP